MNILDKITDKFNLPLGFKRYFLNTGWMFLEKIVRIFTGLFVGVYVARYLGPEQFGILSYAISLVALFTAFSNLGLDGILVREFVEKNKDDHHSILGTSFILKLTLSFLVFLFFVSFFLFSSGDRVSNLVILVIASGLIFKSFDVIQFFYESQVLSKYYVHAQLFAILTIAFLKLVFIYLKLPLIYFAVAISAESLLLAAGLFFIYFKKTRSKKWFFSRKTALGLLKDSWPLILSGLAVSVYMRIDQVMIKHMLDAESVGQYAAAVRISEVWYFVPVVICGSLFPAVLNAKKESSEIYERRMQSLYRIMFLFSLPIALLITFIAGPIVEILLGNSYFLASPVLQIHIWAGVFVFIGVARGKWLLAENLQRYSFLYMGIGLVTNVFGNYLLIKRMGINGAALATLASQFTVALLAPSIFKKTRVSVVMILNSLTFKKRQKYV